MRKVFTDSHIWRQQWYRELPCKYKEFWRFLCENCEAGIWSKDIPLASFQIGEDIDEKEFLSLINKDKERIKILNGGEKWFIVEYIEFQFGRLSWKCAPHRPVIEVLQKYDFNDLLLKYGIKRVSKPLTKGSHNLEEKEKEKEKDKDKEKDKEKEKEIIADLNLVLGTAYKDTSLKTHELISARFNEGFKVEDFKAVHRKMLRTWGTDEKMVKYLRPITLYGPKFESYLNQKEPQTKLTEAGVKAYIVGQSWLSKEVSNAK